MIDYATGRLITMRVYFFDVETGIFQGESFESDAFVCENDGVTAIVPPNRSEGTVPVYDPGTRSWQLCDVKTWEAVRQK